MEDKKYYKILDIIRIFSCIAVFLYHLNILKGGYLAVCVFFVLSGYLSCISSFRKEKFSFKDYYLNRLKHIYLPLLFVVFISIAVISFIPKVNWLTLKPETFSVLGGYNNFWQINANMDYFARHVSSPFMHFWYIAILLQFELLFPIIFIGLKKLGEKKKLIPIIILIILSILSTVYFFISSMNDTNIMNVYYNSLTRVFSIILGLSLGFIFHYYKVFIPFKNRIINKIIFCIYLIILLVLFIFIDSKSSLFSYAMILSSLITLRIIDYSTLFTGELNLFYKITKYLANISYEIYLFQYPVIFIFQYIILKNYISIPLIFIITIISSIILHQALDLKNKKIYKYILLVLISIISLFGLYKFIIEEDHTKEMNALREELAKNEEEMKLKQKEYQEKLKKENEEFQRQLEELENGSNNLNEVIKNLPVVGVGDSVMLGAVPRLYNTFPNGYFDAKVSRTDYEANGILVNMANNGLLSDTVVIHLGTNGQCGNRCRDVIMNTLGNRKVFWVTVTNDYDVHVNAGLKEYARNHNSYIIDWEEAGKGHPEYFAADKIHLNSSGITAYCNLVYESIYNVYKEDLEKKKEEMINNRNNEMKKKITFYGNDLLINGFSYIEKDYPEADFVMDKDFDYTKLINSIKKKKPNYNTVLVFDSNFKINNNQYKELINILKDNKVYIIIVNNSNVKLDNVTIIDFYKEIEKNPDYIMVDNIHLTDKGNKELNKLLNKKIEIK